MFVTITTKHLFLFLLCAVIQLNAMNSSSLVPDEKTYKKLYDLCKYSAPEKIKNFIETHPNIDINYQNKEGRTCALHAAYHQNWDAACYLIKDHKINTTIFDASHQTLFSQALYGTYKIPPQPYYHYQYLAFDFPLKKLLHIYTPMRINLECKKLPLPSRCYNKKKSTTSPTTQTIINFIEKEYKIKSSEWQTNRWKTSDACHRKIQKAILNSIKNKYIPVTIELLRHDSRRLTSECYNGLFHYPETLFILREFFTKSFDYHKITLLLTIFNRSESNDTTISSFSAFPRDITDYIKTIFCLIGYWPLLQTEEEHKIEIHLWSEVCANILWEKIDTDVWKKIQSKMNICALSRKDRLQHNKYILDHLLQLPPHERTQLNIDLLMTSNIYVDYPVNDKWITKRLYEFY
jgi:hypothetical protein